MVSVAVSIGVSLASALVTSILTPKPKPEPGLDDLNILRSEYGVPIPKVYGTAKVNANVVWALPIRESLEGGGKGAQPEQYKYYATFAALLCEGEIHLIGRVWLNNKLIYSPDTGTLLDEYPPGTSGFGKLILEAGKAAEQFESTIMTIYKGSNTQDVDPIIEAEEGIGNAPAFRNYCYLMFNDLPLEDYGNVVPKVEAEVISKDGVTTIAEVLVDICGKAGIEPSKVDASAITGEFTGGLFRQGGDAPRDFIEDLQKAYLFISKESKGIISFVPVEQADIREIAINDLGTKEDSEDAPNLYKETKAQLIDLPSQLSFEFSNRFNEYKVGNQSAYKSIANHINEVNFRTGLVLSDNEAKLAATKNLEYLWAQQFKYEGIKLPIEYADLEPGDLITIPVRQGTVTLQIQKVNIGANTIVEVDGLTYSQRVNNLTTNVENFVYTPNIFVPFFGLPDTEAIETNLLRDSDNPRGVYVSPQPPDDSSGWSGGDVYVDPGTGNFVLTQFIAQAAPYGRIVSGILRPYPAGVLDSGSKITVELDFGTINNVTEAQLYNYDQVMYIDGELIAFQNANLVAEDTYELSNFIRGIRGTESFISSHGTGKIVHGISRFADVEGDNSLLGVDIEFKSVPTNTAESQVTLTDTVTFEGVREKPYAPKLLSAIKKSNNDWELNWERRTRLDGGWLANSETVPLNESIEAYRVIIYSNTSLNTIVRQADVSSKTFTYTEADQISDFGSIRSSLNFAIIQLSQVVGEGYPETRTNFKPTIVEP